MAKESKTKDNVSSVKNLSKEMAIEHLIVGMADKFVPADVRRPKALRLAELSTPDFIRIKQDMEFALSALKVLGYSVVKADPSKKENSDD